MNQQRPLHPYVKRSSSVGAITIGFAAYRLHAALDLPPGGAAFLGSVVGWIVGSLLGRFVVDEDGNVRSFFAAAGGLAGAVLALAAAGGASASGFETAISVAVGAAVGSALGRALWWLLAIAAFVTIWIGPRLLTQVM